MGNGTCLLDEPQGKLEDIPKVSLVHITISTLGCKRGDCDLPRSDDRCNFRTV